MTTNKTSTDGKISKLKSHNRTEKESPNHDIIISNKLFLELCRPCGNSFRKLVDFRKTRFHDSARQSEAESINEKNGGLSGGTMWRDFRLIQLSYFKEKPTIETSTQTGPLQATV